jgi:hypothetical protein
MTKINLFTFLISMMLITQCVNHSPYDNGDSSNLSGSSSSGSSSSSSSTGSSSSGTSSSGGTLTGTMTVTLDGTTKTFTDTSSSIQNGQDGCYAYRSYGNIGISCYYYDTEWIEIKLSSFAIGDHPLSSEWNPTEYVQYKVSQPYDRYLGVADSFYNGTSSIYISRFDQYYRGTVTGTFSSKACSYNTTRCKFLTNGSFSVIVKAWE